MADDEPITITRFARTLLQSFPAPPKAVRAAPEHEIQKLARRLTPSGGREEEVVRSIVAPNPVYPSRVNPAPQPAARSPRAPERNQSEANRSPAQALDDRPVGEPRMGRVRTPLFNAFAEIEKKPEGKVLIASRDVREILAAVRKIPGYGNFVMKDQTVRDAITAWLKTHG